MEKDWFASQIPVILLPYFSAGALLTYGQLSRLYGKYKKVIISNKTLGERLFCDPRSIRRYISELANKGVIEVHTTTKYRKTKRNIVVPQIEGSFIIIPDKVMKINRKALPNRAKLLYGLLDKQVRKQIKILKDTYEVDPETYIDNPEVDVNQLMEDSNMPVVSVTITETELAETMHVAPQTVRRALNQLRQQNAITSMYVNSGESITVELNKANFINGQLSTDSKN